MKQKQQLNLEMTIFNTAYALHNYTINYVYNHYELLIKLWTMWYSIFVRIPSPWYVMLTYCGIWTIM